MSSLPRTDSIPVVRCTRCKFIESTPEEMRKKQISDEESCLGDGLLDPPPTHLHLRRAPRSRSRSSSPSFENARRIVRLPNSLLVVSNRTKKTVLDDRMRIDCNRIGKHDCNVGKEDDAVDERWDRVLERGRRGEESTAVPAERGRSRRSRKDCFTADKSLHEPSAVEPAPAHYVNKSVPTEDDKLRFQQSLDSATSMVFHTTMCTSGTGAQASLLGQRFPHNKFLRPPPFRLSSAPLLGSFEVPSAIDIGAITWLTASLPAGIALERTTRAHVDSRRLPRRVGGQWLLLPVARPTSSQRVLL